MAQRIGLLPLMVESLENAPGYHCIPKWAIKSHYLIDYSLYYLFCRKLGIQGQNIKYPYCFPQAIELKSWKSI